MNDSSRKSKFRGQPLRRLAIEVMERRQMLSAATMDLTAFAPPLRDGPITLSAATTEGGYISIVSPTNSLRSNGFVTNLIDAAAGVDVSDLITSDSTLFNDSLSYGGGVLKPAEQFGGHNLEPAAVGFWPDNGAGSRIEPGIVHAPDAPAEREGGAIAIAPILGELRRPASDVAEFTLAKLVDATDRETDAVRSVAMTGRNSAIVGEWARALVFERIDDGSPAVTGTTKAKPNVPNAPSHQLVTAPATSAATASAASTGPTMRVASTKDKPAVASEVVLETAIGGDPSGGPVLTRLPIDDHAYPDAFADPAALLGDISSDERARHVAFSDWRREDFASPLVAIGVLRGSRDVMPLLLVLALERIAAQGSRRSVAVDATQAAVRSRRPAPAA